MHLIVTPDTVTVVDDNNVHTKYRKSLKRLMKDDPELAKEFKKHLTTGRKEKPKRPQHYPYIASFNRLKWTYLVRRYDGTKVKEAIFYHPNTNPTVEEVLRFNIEFAKTRTKPLNRYEKEKAQKAHERLERILGPDYEAFPLKRAQE